MYKTRILRQYVLIGMLVASSFTGGLLTTAAQDAGISIIAQSVGCAVVTVTYSIAFAAPGEAQAVISVHNNQGVAGYTTGPAGPGRHTANVKLAPVQPANTSLYVVVAIGPASAQGAPTACSPSSSGGGGSGNNSSSSQPGPPPWGGFSDGRLSPVPEEYYSVWCQSGLVWVWQGVPKGVLLKQIPLRTVIDKTGSFDAGEGLTVTRNDDLVTVSGSNGNSRPAPGVKSFSLKQCIERNGGVPPVATATPVRRQSPLVQRSTATPTPTPTPDESEALCHRLEKLLPGIWKCEDSFADNLFILISLALHVYCGVSFPTSAALVLVPVAYSKRRKARRQG